MTTESEINTILAAPASSQWLKQALESALDRDCADAARDAKTLHHLLERRALANLCLDREAQDHQTSPTVPELASELSGVQAVLLTLGFTLLAACVCGAIAWMCVWFGLIHLKWVYRLAAAGGVLTAAASLFTFYHDYRAERDRYLAREMTREPRRTP
ncbi:MULTISPECIES: hypothetical protein [Pseudomonas]|jgi:hypothetical protein|uniref:Transmembrane protein n=3 Tax=Pseudomonas TaxID=286 RepID=A0A1L7NP19_PSEPU|nr:MULTISPECIES: hypothetical protein [Pseudomonas]HCF2574566.1 hypothetical protein [Pseudomonas aeruginosa]AGN82415.1 hypothetical protein L483_15895 [Pseudomonas putida H8234]ELS0926881.1 hypothetical protein [Pseudomonas putida]ENY78161.1 hypothetical protein C206_08499 [Pseudomonas putida TRO1]KYC17461.1 hypothetical protein WM94_21720 [Pseudomonas sp. ABFPK]